MVKVSFIVITADEDYPYVGNPNLHVFEPITESLKTQSMKDFELVIVDACYHKRREYFEKVKLPFKVKHIPAQPNVWIERKSPGVCAQYNKGIIYADGELLFFTGISYMVRPDFIKNLWERYTQGFFPLAWYLFDQTQGGKREYKDPGTPRTTTPVPYDVLGYNGQDVFIEHRYNIAFKGNNEMYPAPWIWYFGCSSASLEAMLEINGFNLWFDGDRMLLDCDVGSRLDLAGYGRHLALFKNIFLIRVPTDSSKWSAVLPKSAPTIKCQLPMIHYSRYINESKTNTSNISEEMIKWAKEEYCAKYCNIRELCKKEHPWQYPFEHKAGYGHTSNKELFELWKNTPTLIDLRAERQKRIDGDAKYSEGTFT